MWWCLVKRYVVFRFIFSHILRLPFRYFHVFDTNALLEEAIIWRNLPALWLNTCFFVFTCWKLLYLLFMIKSVLCNWKTERRIIIALMGKTQSITPRLDNISFYFPTFTWEETSRRAGEQKQHKTCFIWGKHPKMYNTTYCVIFMDNTTVQLYLV